MIEEPCLCHTNVFVSNEQQDAFRLQGVTLVQRLGQVTILRKAYDCKVARHRYPGYRYYTL
jgi:hypothetical protein